MSNKYYAVKEGYDFASNKEVKDLILGSWDECLKYVKGAKGAKYKSFKTRGEAEEYLQKDTSVRKKGSGEYPEDCLHIYVDGSFSTESERYAYAFVAVRNNVIVNIENGISKDNSKKQLRQIAGELEAAYRAVLYAYSQGEKKVAIFYDYAGISHHALGTWERKDESSRKYHEVMNRLMSEKGMEIIFVKTDGHSGDIYNEMADNFAKMPLKLKLNTAVDKYLKDNCLVVSVEEIRGKLKAVVKAENMENITLKAVL
ncbi:MAG: viroplasmin family protein [Clostridiaceae bacterium]